jgi:Signal peptide peptidase
VVTHAAGFSLGLTWLIIAFTVRDAETLTFFWVTQDIFGACMCITFLNVIRLNSIRVASILLIVAFFYDIFFVFVTPHLFHGKSVMITVATSGGPPKADALWCEKYPDDPNCQGGNPLPMLLAVPKLFDYLGGSSLLGLGDIVLPGLLLSFAARYDAAKALVGVRGGGRRSNQSYNCPEQQLLCGTYSSSSKYGCCWRYCCSGGYYGPLLVAYAVGLAMANTAVYVMNMGQPALLYLVPCCLGTMIYIGWRRQELTELWHGPRVLQSADAMVFPDRAIPHDEDNEQGGDHSSHALSLRNMNQHQPLPMHDDDDGLDDDHNGDVLLLRAVDPPSAVDDDNDTMIL